MQVLRPLRVHTKGALCIEMVQKKVHRKSAEKAERVQNANKGCREKVQKRVQRNGAPCKERMLPSYSVPVKVLHYCYTVTFMAAESVNLANLVRCTLVISAAHQYLLIAKMAYGTLKNLKISGGLRPSPQI